MAPASVKKQMVAIIVCAKVYSSIILLICGYILSLIKSTFDVILNKY